MKTFLTLIVLAGAAAGAWFWWHHREQTPGSPSAFATAVQGDPAVNTNPQPAETPLPAAAKTALDQADALWSTLESEGQKPETNAMAPKLDLLYSAVLKAIYNKPGQKSLEQRLIDTRLTPLGHELFFARTKFPNDDSGLMASYQAQPGDNPDAVAKKFGMSRELLNRLRGAKPDESALHPDDTLKIVKAVDKGGSFLHVDKGDFVMDVFLGGAFVKRYTISHGAKDSPTPVGTAKIVKRVLYPDWTHPDTKEVLKYGDPRNILGPIWLPIDSVGLGQTGIGIHGYTGADAQVGALVSHGCIRLKNDDALEFYYTIADPGRCAVTIEIVE